MKYNFCKNCGSPVQPGMPNCQRCGAPVDQIQPVDENKPMAQPPGMLRQYYGDNNGTNNQQPVSQPMNNASVQQPMGQPPMGQPMNNPGMQQPMGQPPMGQPMNNPGMQQPMGQPPMPNNQVPQQGSVDDGSVLWAVVGFLIPIVGLILYFVWKDTKPKNAKMAIMGAGIGFVANIIIYATGILSIGI